MSAPPPNSDKSVGEIVSEVSEKASLLVREEIELAKAEVTGKVKTLGKGAGVGAAAGVFLFFAFVMFLFTMSFFWVDLLNIEVSIWIGFAHHHADPGPPGRDRRAAGQEVAVQRAAHAGHGDRGGQGHP